jgi:hypothetical protein
VPVFNKIIGMADPKMVKRLLYGQRQADQPPFRQSPRDKKTQPADPAAFS